MAARKKKRTVVVADDEPQLLGLVARKLAKLGYDVVEAGDGDAALRLVRERRPDAVVLDVMMPGKSGWEVCRSIRDDEELRGIAVLMLTGIGERLNEMTSPLYGADEFVDKPFDFADLEKKLAAAIEKRRRRG